MVTFGSGKTESRILRQFSRHNSMEKNLFQRTVIIAIFASPFFVSSFQWSFSSCAGEPARAAATNDFSKPLTLADALNIALRQSAAIQKARADLEAAFGVIVQTRAIALPKLRAAGNFQANDP